MIHVYCDLKRHIVKNRSLNFLHVWKALAREVAQELRPLAYFAEYLVSIPSTHTEQFIIAYSIIFCPLWIAAACDVHTDKQSHTWTYTYNNKLKQRKTTLQIKFNSYDSVNYQFDCLESLSKWESGYTLLIDWEDTLQLLSGPFSSWGFY